MKRTLSSFLAAGLLALAAGCATQPESPAQAVFSMKSTYNGALVAAVAYKRLPVCAPAPVYPCSDPKVVAQIQKADIVAVGALDAAESAVRSPGFGKDAINSAVTAARAALAALASITANLGAPK